MSFKFDFQLDEQDVDEEFTLVEDNQRDANRDSHFATQDQKTGSASSSDCYHVSLDELLDSLPNVISYTSLHHPLLRTPLLRRDLFDARFQLISESSTARRLSQTTSTELKGKGKAAEQLAAESIDEEDDIEEKFDEEGEAYVDAATDLIPGLYEGGLKTWEGGMDLFEVIAEGLARDQSWLEQLTLLEVGCGTALPTSFILHSILSSSSPSSVTKSPSSSSRRLSVSPPQSTTQPKPSAGARNLSQKCTLHLQDFNLPVLKLVTLPNLLLASLPFLPPDSLRSADDNIDIEGVVADLHSPGHLNITSELKAGFKKFLEDRGVELKFTYGHWRGLARELNDNRKRNSQPQNSRSLVITAETIYAEDSVEDLLAVLRGATFDQTKSFEEGHSKQSLTSSIDKRESQRGFEVELEDTFGTLSVKDDWVRGLVSGEAVVLVAAKVLYFGVGGGFAQFLSRVENEGGWWASVKQWTKGVGRKVVRIGW